MARTDRVNVDGVATLDAYRTHPLASCTACDWSRDELDGDRWLTVRAAARRHAGATGHRTNVSVRTGFLYVRQRPARP